MVNHFRTMLLNVSGASAPGADYPGEQYVPPLFQAKRLPQPLAAARRLLVGTAPDRATLNWRLQEILSIIHGCGLEDYVTALDPRVTYWPFNTSLLEKVLVGATALKRSGGDTQSLYFVGSNRAGASTDRIYFQWLLEVISDAQVRITSAFSTSSELVDYTVSGGLSSIIPLPGSELRVRFGEGVGAAWNISILVPPRLTLNNLLRDADSGLDQASLDYLFPTDSAEPYKSFENLYLYHDQAPYRLAGLALAVGYRIHELPV